MYIPIYRIAAVVAVLLVFVAEPLQALSFDCPQANEETKKMVISSPELSMLHKELGDAFLSLFAEYSTPDQEGAHLLTKECEARDQCQTTACLVEFYKQGLVIYYEHRLKALAPPVPPSTVLSPAAQPSVSASKPPNIVQECDALAAHPDDPEAFTVGISDEILDAPTVIRVCEAAVNAEPQTPRLRFQLARGYLKADRIEDAIEQLIDAAQESHGGALAYLADLHVEGAPGIEADPVLARSLYEKAVASGFEPAKKIIAEFEDKTDEYAKAEAEENVAEKATVALNAATLKPYAMPEIIENIYNRKFDDIPFNESWTKTYLIYIADNIRAICESNFTQREVDGLKAEADADHFNLGQSTFGATLMGGLALQTHAIKNPNEFMSQAASENRLKGDSFEHSMKDTEALFQRHSCNTPGLAQFGKNLKAFVQNEEAPLPAPNAIRNACLKDPAPSKIQATEFCLCFTGGLSYARVSQANRKGLTKNFKETAMNIMNIDRNRGQFQACQEGF